MIGGPETPTPLPPPARAQPSLVPTDPTAAPHLTLVVRSTDGADERHVLDVAVMTTDPARLAKAAEAARSGERLDVDGEADGAGIAVFDLRSPGHDSAPASGGCRLIGRRGPVRVALLVD